MVVVVLIALLTAWPIVAQAHDESRPETPMLTVSATGSLSLAPDTAFVTFGLETAGKSLADTQRRNSAVMNRVMDRLRDLQIDKERIQTWSFTVSPQYRPQPNRPADGLAASSEIIGYIVSNMVTVEIRVLDRVGTVIEEVLKVGANNFQGLRWALRDEHTARLDALKSAAARAREKAAALSGALHVKLGRILSVNEGGQMVRPMPYMERSMATMDAGGGQSPISAGEMVVEATVTLIYEVAPN
jgi:uncharacterized protein